MRCFHCTEDVDPRDGGRWQVTFDGAAHDVCCAGCEAVASTIVAAGLDDYYRFRTEPATFGLVPPELATELAGAAPGVPIGQESTERWSVYDTPEVSERYVVARADGSAEVVLAIEGMRCGACVWLLQRGLATLPGVASASVNYASERARVSFDPARLTLSALLARVAAVGYRATPFDADARDLAEARAQRLLLQRLFVAGLGATQVMMYALPGYLDGDIEARFVELLRWASLVLTTPVLLFSAQPFFAGAWRDIKARAPGMDVPVSIGLAVGFTASVVHTLQGAGEVWFDSVAMFVFLLLGARWFERAARHRARRALDKVLGAVPATAHRRVGHGDDEIFERVPAQRLVVGDLVRVDSGERVPADGTVRGAGGAVDLSLLSGESEPVPITAGVTVPGGALVAGSPLLVEVARAAADSTLSVIGELVDRGASERPRIAWLADRIARVFVVVLLTIVAVVFAVWWQIDPARAPVIAIAVMIVSCPCALSMATPAALAAASGRLLGAGVLVTRGHALEAMASVGDVVFDKTGTLTLGAPRVVAVATADGLDEDAALALAARLDAGAAHPYARALGDAARASGGTAARQPRAAEVPGAAGPTGPRLAAAVHEAGLGVSAADLDEPLTWTLGSARHCGLDAAQAEAWRARSSAALADASDVFLTRRRQGEPPTVLARFAFEDPLRPGAAGLIRTLRSRRVRVHLLSGDRAAVAQRVAAACGIDSVTAEATPAAKQAVVRDLQAGGAKVLMVGDGVNDAPVMAVADVSLAVGRASDLARSAADAVALRDGIDAVAETLEVARRTRRVIRQNLGWALGYNALAIPFTAAGLVPAWAAAVGMATSSLLVSANALRLLRKERRARGPADGAPAAEPQWTR